jgi:hypothetical protein
MQSTPPHPISLRSILIISTHLRFGLPSGVFHSGFPTNILYAFLLSPIRTTCRACRTHTLQLLLFRYFAKNSVGPRTAC